MKKLAKKIAESKKTEYQEYNYKKDFYSAIRGSVCTNMINYHGFEFGQFECPIEGFDYAATNCCGKLYEQYCCTTLEIEHDKLGFYHPYETTSDMINLGTFVKAKFFENILASFFFTFFIKFEINFIL